ncbi:F-box domain-containing protein [Mycena kentingensis (nom. inval.)]|nr:F-box domain-containing protein [Mycena kentingensis (nom. inval.)]
MSSTLDDVLHTNYVPNEAQVAAIRADIGPRLFQVDALDGEIRALIAQRDELVAYINPRVALVSPCRRLPAEILRKIFMDCLPENSTAAYEPGSAPLLLGRVCSRWRDVAHGTPELWASIHVPFSFFAREVDRTEALDAWLSRSGTRPLTLSIVGTQTESRYLNAPPEDPYQPAVVDAALSILIRHAPRWKHLQLSKLTEDMAYTLLTKTAPAVASVEFMDRIPVTSGSSRVFRSPNLRRLALILHRPDLYLWHLPIHWKRIVELSLGDISGARDAVCAVTLQDVHTILSLCKRLQHFRCVVNHDAWDAASSGIPPTAVSVPQLKSFTILSGGYTAPEPHASATYFWSYISSMPSLDMLIVAAKLVPSDATLLAILTTTPNLRMLTTPRPRSATSLQGILTALPRISSLRFTVDTRSNDSFPSDLATSLLELLTPPTSTLCPHLCALDLPRCAPVPSSTIRTFLYAHLSALTPLRQLRVHFTEGQEEPILSQEEEEVFRAAQRVWGSFSFTRKRDQLRPRPTPGFGTRAAEGRQGYSDYCAGMRNLY